MGTKSEKTDRLVARPRRTRRRAAKHAVQTDLFALPELASPEEPTKQDSRSGLVADRRSAGNDDVSNEVDQGDLS